MGKIVLSAVTFVLVLATTLFVIKKIPQVRALKACYEQTNAIYREENIVARRAYTKDEAICARHKIQVLKGVECFAREEYQLEAVEQELPWLKKAARVWAKVTMDVDEVIADHNSRCDEDELRIEPYELEDIRLKYSL